MIEQIASHIRSLIPGVVEVLEKDSDHLTLRIGHHRDALISIRVSDPMRPSFRVSYPKLVVKKNGSRHVTEVTADGVVTEGIDWIVEQPRAHGFVRPELG